MTANKFITALAGAILVMGVLIPAQAQDKKVDPTGTYIWTMPGRNGGPDRTNTLVLKLDGDKLTGTLASPGRGGQATPRDISDGKVTGSDISFCVTRTFNDNTVTNKYSGHARGWRHQGQNGIRAERRTPVPRLGGQAAEITAASNPNGKFARSRKVARFILEETAERKVLELFCKFAAQVSP